MFSISGTNDHFHINLEDEVTRGAIVLKAGEMLWPPPPPPSMAAVQAPPKTIAKAEPPNPFNETLKDTFMYSTGTFLCAIAGILLFKVCFKYFLFVCRFS